MMKELSKEKYFNYYNKEIHLKKLQQELNYIQFDLINNYEKVVELCGVTGYDNETLLYVDFKIAKYVIKLIPVK